MKAPGNARLTEPQIQRLWLLREGGTLYSAERSLKDKHMIYWIEHGGFDYSLSSQGFWKMWRRQVITKTGTGTFVYSGSDLYVEFGPNGSGWAEHPRKEIETKATDQKLSDIFELANQLACVRPGFAIVFNGFADGWGEVQYVNEAGDKSGRQFKSLDHLQGILVSMGPQ